MSVNFLRDLSLTVAVKSSARRAWLPALALLLCLALPAGAQPYTPKQSDADALAGIKANNDLGGWLTGNNWDGSPVIYNNTNGVTWDGVNPGAQVIELDVKNKQLTGKLDATGMAELTSLNAYNNQLSSLDVSQNTALTELNASRNQLTSLDVSQNTALTGLAASNNRLTSLDVSHNALLTELYASNNQLTSLDVSKNTKLTNLEAGSNQLTSLDVSKNTALTTLDAQGNQLTSLDVSNNALLAELYASDNQLTSLDVSQNTALTDLGASNNQLTSLDLSQNTALTGLAASNNQLTSLGLSHNALLAELYAGSNQLTSLDVSNNIALTKLYVNNNQLTSLDVSKNIALTNLNVGSNQLTSLDVSKNTNLETLYVSGNRLNSLDLTNLNSLTELGMAETGLSLTGLNLPQPGQLYFLEMDPTQLAQGSFSALTGLTQLGIYSSTGTPLTLQLNSTFPGQISQLTITAPQASSLDFGAYAPNLAQLSITPGRLERISGADNLDKTAFERLAIGSNRLPLSQLAPLVSAVNQGVFSHINVTPQSQVWFESQTARNKPFDLSAQLAGERTLLNQATKFRLLPAAAVTTSSSGTVSVKESLALKDGQDYTLGPDGKLKITKAGKYYLLMSNPALYNWAGGTNLGDILALSGLLVYQTGIDPVPVPVPDPDIKRYADLAANANPNARRMAALLDWAVDNGKAGPLQDMLNKIDNAATTAEALHYLNQMHGESTASAKQYFAFNMKNLFKVMDTFAMTPADSVLLGGSDAPAFGEEGAAHAGQPWRVKLRMVGNWGDMSGHDGYYGYDSRSYGGVLALERDITDRLTLGAAGAFSHSDVDFDNYGNTAESDDWAMALYGRYQYEDWFAGARAGYGQSSASIKRHLPGVNLTARSSPDIDYFSAALFTGYDFYLGDGSWRITPVAGLNWLSAHNDSFSEIGADAYNLSYGSDTYESLEALLNVTAAKRIDLGNNSALTPRLNAGIGYEMADDQVSMRSTFGDIPDFPHFGVDSPDVGRTRLLAGAGVDWHVTDHVDLSVEYQGSFQQDYTDHTGLASFRVSW